jgi:tryptophan-rich sensory protein
LFAGKNVKTFMAQLKPSRPAPPRCGCGRLSAFFTTFIFLLRFDRVAAIAEIPYFLYLIYAFYSIYGLLILNRE